MARPKTSKKIRTKNFSAPKRVAIHNLLIHDSNESSIGKRVFFKNNGYLDDEPEEATNLDNLNQVLFILHIKINLKS